MCQIYSTGTSLVPCSVTSSLFVYMWQFVQFVFSNCFFTKMQSVSVNEQQEYIYCVANAVCRYVYCIIYIAIFSSHCYDAFSTKGNTHTHTFSRLTAPFPWLPRWASTRKVKPIWILLKQETVSGSGISWAICESVSRSRQITMPVLHDAKFFAGRMAFLPPNQQRQSTEGKTTKGNNPQNYAPSLWGIRAPNTWFLWPTRKPKQQLNQLIHFPGLMVESKRSTNRQMQRSALNLWH